MKYIVSTVAAVSVATTITSPSFAMNCVAYAREVTGMNLSGDAWHWWDSASGVYPRGRSPAPGAVMVFQRTSHMVHGHVAVVREVLGARHILIDQANWLTGRMRGAITEAVSAVDVSPNNDWSSVQIQWQRSSDYGRSNPIRGFIYADATPSNRPHLIDAVYTQPTDGQHFQSTISESDEDTDTHHRSKSRHHISRRTTLHHPASHQNCSRKTRSASRRTQSQKVSTGQIGGAHKLSAHAQHSLSHPVAAQPNAAHSTHHTLTVHHASTPARHATSQKSHVSSVHAQNGHTPDNHTKVLVVYHTSAHSGAKAVKQKPITHQIRATRS